MSSLHRTGQDARAHVRGESIAYQRRPNAAGSTAVHVQTTASGEGTSTPNHHQGPPPSKFSRDAWNRRDSRSTTADAFGVHATRRRNRFLRRLALALAALYALGHCFSAWQYQRRVVAMGRERKTLMAGAGESHLLPKRWRDAEERPSSVGSETLSTCKRVMLFKFTSTEGLASEMLGYVRAGVIANKLGYTLLADDVEWNYGALRDYFMPRSIHCRPPKDWFMTEPATALGTRRWQGQDRIWFSRQHMKHADDWIREETLDPDAMDEMRHRQLGPVLREGETLPASLEEVFADASAVLRELWKPHDQLATMIRRQRMELGLGDGAVRGRKNSPTWGGAKRRSEESRNPGRADAEQVDEDVRDYDQQSGAERNDRGPVIGVHVPLLAEQLPLTDLRLIGVQRAQTDDRFALVMQGVNDALRRLSKNSIAEPSYSRNHPTLFPSSAKAHVVVVSGEKDADVVVKLAHNDLARNMDIKRTSSPPADELRQWSNLTGVENARTDTSKIVTEFDQKTFNSLPKSLRVHLTRYLLRDLTTLALYADAFVVHGTSSVGRLALLLAGEDAVVGPREISGHGLGGRVRSVDGWWFPSSQVSALWDQL
ncbi:BQ2448_4961 [Microbotryum intermedium]|uniref:BQ2448_4961 protein n=1 Tax=Microbotryum intermedium TaxID=269621 RepID=A0A238FGA5_9BASI|nr:BQ2448_4961 [Microbotryum intermedium]